MNFYEIDWKTGVYYHLNLMDYDSSYDDIYKISHGELSSEKKYAFKVFSGKSGGDLLTCDVPAVYIVSDNFLKVAHKNNLTGFYSGKISLKDKKGNQIDVYNILSITGKCSKFEYSNEIIQEQSKYNPNYIKKLHAGMIINSTDWDGSDFFRCKDLGSLIISEKAYKVLKVSNLKNVNIEDVTKLKIPTIFSDMKNSINK